MKGLFAGLVILLIMGGAAFFGLKYLSSRSEQYTPAQSFKTVTTKLTGIVQRSKGDDYDFVIYGEGKSTGITSYTVKLEDYVGKKIEAEGQYSGTTFYTDQVIRIQ
jgi:hypothetical protein